MESLTEVSAWLEAELPALVEKHGAPGAAVGVLLGGDVVDAAAGVLSAATGVEATTDSVFQIGSVTKLWTTSLVLQLVDDGLLGLDDPVRRHLPEFRTSDEDASARITVRQLLCHTAGFEGDIFTDTGRGDDAVEKYLASIDGVPQLVPPGEVFSYNNTGFVVLGRLVEVLRGKPFDTVLVERLAAPLGLTHVSPSPYEAILHRAAVGHLGTDDHGAPLPAPTWALARSNGPAGSMLAMRPRDLLGFVRMHLDGGTAPDGTVVLSPASVAAMQAQQTDVPDISGMGTGWGLGWELHDTPTGTVIAHDGGTIGQVAFLRVVPERRLAVCVLVNGGDFFAIYDDIVAHLVRELAGVELPARPVPPAEGDREPVDAAPYVGRYGDDINDIEVTQDADGRVWLARTPKGIIAELGEQPTRTELVRLRGSSLIALEPSHGVHPVYAFLGDTGDGRAAYVHYGRAVARA